MVVPLYIKRRWILASWLVLIVVLYAFKNSSLVVRVLSTIATIALVYGIDHYFQVDFKPIHYIFVYIMVVSAFLLSPLYYIYPSYDKVQHFILPILFATLVFHVVCKLRLHRKWELFFTVAIVIASLALFELGEYALDYFFDLKLQGVFMRGLTGLDKYDILMDRNDDTMIDLMLGTLGTGVYWIGNLLLFFKKTTRAKKQTSIHRKK